MRVQHTVMSVRLGLKVLGWKCLLTSEDTIPLIWADPRRVDLVSIADWTEKFGWWWVRLPADCGPAGDGPSPAQHSPGNSRQADRPASIGREIGVLIGTGIAYDAWLTCRGIANRQ
jgi:hypothetical protein